MGAQHASDQWDQRIEEAKRLGINGDCAKAASCLKQLVTEKPGSAEARFYLGVTRLQGGETAAAVACLSQATAAARESPHALTWLGKALRLQGQVGKVVDAFEAALRLDGKNLRALSALGSIFAFDATGPVTNADVTHGYYW